MTPEKALEIQMVLMNPNALPLEGEDCCLAEFLEN